MKTIKKTRQVKLEELIGYIIKNKVISRVFESNQGDEVSVSIDGELTFFGRFNHNDIFTITEEVEITEDTRLNLVVVDNECCIQEKHHAKISKVLKDYEDYGIDIKFIYIQNDDGKVGQLIWEDGEWID